MLVHFAFGGLTKQGKLEEQTDAVIEYILKEKRLKVSKCKEFIPAFPTHGAKRIPPDMFKATDFGASAAFYPQKDPEWFKKLPDDTTIHYLPIDVGMVCFIKISLAQLKNTTHSNEYGKFGIVLSADFLKASQARPIYYYTEESLWNDPLITKWNYYAKNPGWKQKTETEKEIVSFRKPATLFASFREDVVMKVTKTSSGSIVEHLTYDRYKEGYDFRQENEYRIVFDDGVDYLNFKEKDLFMVIVPNEVAQYRIQSFFNQNWEIKPQVIIYPS